MSNLVFRDGFDDLRHWTGVGHPYTFESTSSPHSMQAINLVSKRAYFGVDEMSIRFYDNGVNFTLSLFLGDSTILTFSPGTTFYQLTEGSTQTTGGVVRSTNWHTLRIEIKDNYRLFVDDTFIGATTGAARRGMSVRLTGGIWDDFEVTRVYNDDYQGGTGGLDDLKIQDLEILSGGQVRYTVEPGYFYVDDIEYYLFANMGVAAITPNPSGLYTFPSGLPYQVGSPYFVVDADDMAVASGYVRTPVDRTYRVSWDLLDDGSCQPAVSGAYDPFLVYEAGTTRMVTLSEPLVSTKMVLTSEGGEATTVRSDSSYIDYVNAGDTYQAYAVVTDKYGGPISNATVRWKTINQDNVILDAGASLTDANGVATTAIVVTDEGSFHIYAEVNPSSRPDWIRAPLPIADIQGSVFQLDDSDVRLDAMEGRAAQGYNIWNEPWGTNPGEPTGLGPPNYTTHGQWEAAHPEQRRPPYDQDLAASEADGYWNGHDFEAAYPAIVTAGVEAFMDPMFVARKGYWGQRIVSGAQIQAGSDSLGAIASGQILNPSVVYEITRDNGATTGSYNTVLAAGSTYDSVFFVFYQAGSAYDGSTPDWDGNFYFRGVAVYDESLDQSNSQVQDIVSNAALQQ